LCSIRANADVIASVRIGDRLIDPLRRRLKSVASPRALPNYIAGSD
jgi:hypothetical protein